MRNTILALMFLLSASTEALAQTQVFTSPPTQQSPPDIQIARIAGFEAQWKVSVDVRRLVANKAARNQLSIRLSDGSNVQIRRTHFEPIAGFIAQMQGENIIDIVPDPALPDSALSYTWYGYTAHPNGTQWLQFTVYQGTISATLSANKKRYSLNVGSGKQLVFSRFDPNKFPGDLDTEIVREKSFAPLLTQKIATNRRFELTPIAQPSKPQAQPENSQEAPVRAKEFRTVDVLVIHTARALANMRGNIDALEARITESFDQANQALRNSGVNTFAFRRTGLSVQVSYDEVFTTVNPRLNPSCTLAPRNCALVSHRMWVRRESNKPDGEVKPLRAAANADLVVLMYETQDSLAGTGAAYIQKFDCGTTILGGESAGGCDRGLAYRDFAFSVVGIQTASMGIVTAHELGHQLGMEHNLSNAGANATFPWSFGYFASGKAQTVMSGATSMECPLSCDRVLQYSNPHIDFQGWPTVPSGSCAAYNALTAQSLSRDTAELFAPTNPSVDWLFASGFDELENGAPLVCEKP